jgi:hypothetical protein
MNSLVLLVALAIGQAPSSADFSGFDSPPAKIVEKVVVRSELHEENERPKIVVKYIYVGKDKFGNYWKAPSEEELKTILDNENARKFTMTDKFGKHWQSSSEDRLRQHIAAINSTQVGTLVREEAWPTQQFYSSLPSVRYGSVNRGCTTGSCGR